MLVYNPNTTGYACSLCGVEFAGCRYYRFVKGGKDMVSSKFSYCPNCRAKIITFQD